MMKIEPVLAQNKPDIVIVPGDVNSTLATALTASKMGIKVAHVEAGLRSFDMTMPEEVNRKVIDSISDFLFTPDETASLNLKLEGVEPERIHFAGNVMIDSLRRHLKTARSRQFVRSLDLKPQNYTVLTLHRPSTTDFKDKICEILDAIFDAVGDLPVIFPIHPRTRNCIAQFGMLDRFTNTPGTRGIWLCEPLGYLDFLSLIADARLVMTDSGGTQEETTALGVRCVTLRDNTERLVTIRQGTNLLAGTQRAGILETIAHALGLENTRNCQPEKWDGKAASRVISTLVAECRT